MVLKWIPRTIVQSPSYHLCQKHWREQYMKKLWSFVTSTIFYYKFQLEFPKNHSTDFCLSYLPDKISKGFDSGLFTRVILTDLWKAFDTIDHNISLLKMPSLGFSREAIDWYKSYLSSRKFRVNVLDKFSTSADLQFGVPQGDILEPVLFSLYIYNNPTSCRLWAVHCSLCRWYMFVIST